MNKGAGGTWERHAAVTRAAACMSSLLISTAHLDHNVGAVSCHRCYSGCAALQIQWRPLIWLPGSAIQGSQRRLLVRCAAALGCSQADAPCGIEQTGIHRCVCRCVQRHCAGAGGNRQDHWHGLLQGWQPAAAAAADRLLHVADMRGRPAACCIARVASRPTPNDLH